jgi:hypothetical protein
MTNHSAFGNYGKIKLPSLARNVNDQIQNFETKNLDLSNRITQ